MVENQEISNPYSWKPWSGWYSFVLTLAKCTFICLGGKIRAINPENMPIGSPVILAPTHFSNLDPPAYACACRRHLRFMAKEELFKGIFGKLIYTVGAFKVKRGTNDTSAIRQAIAILRNDQALIVFPEGARGDGVSIGEINKGVALLARQTEAFIVPAAIFGTHIMLPKGATRVKRHQITVIFGEPFRISDLELTAQGEKVKISAKDFAEELERRLLSLSAEIGLPLRPSLETKTTEN